MLSGDGVGGIVPQTVRQDTPLPEVHFMFRPRARYRDAVITARYRDTVNISEAGENSTAHTASTGGQTGQSNRILIRKRFLALTPGEMCKITIPAEKLKNVPEIIFDIEGTQV